MTYSIDFRRHVLAYKENNDLTFEKRVSTLLSAYEHYFAGITTSPHALLAKNQQLS